jgi:16S rRNA (cytidine1402-2'-O)-methyltransferase
VGTLYLVATPIGNLEDITLRALRVLGEVNLIAAEDTRQTQKLLEHYEIRNELLSYHEHSEGSRREAILARLEQGDVALVSDAGSPGLADPGYELVRAALEGGHEVCPIPGPAAPIAALTASGLPVHSFLYIGYPPRGSAERRRAFERLASETRTLVLFEAPHRLRASLGDLSDAFGEERPAAVCRELTKAHEEILRGSLAELEAHFTEVQPRGEVTLVIAGAPEEAMWSEEEVRAALQDLRRQGLGPSEAARTIAAQAGWRRRDVYRLSLEGS